MSFSMLPAARKKNGCDSEDIVGNAICYKGKM